MNSKWSSSGKVLALKSDFYALGLNNVGTSAPSSPEEGEGWYESDTNAMGWYTGSAWNSNIKVANLVDVNGLELLKFTATGSAVNEITVTNNSTGKWPDVSATGETNVSITMHGKGTGGIFPAIRGYSNLGRGAIVYKDDVDIYLSGNFFEVDGKIAQWGSQLTYTCQNLAASTWSYIYLDYSEITTGVAITNSQITDSTTAPSWSESKLGWYNGSDRCIGCVLADGDTDILKFYWNKHDGFYLWDVFISEGTHNTTPYANVDVTSSIPNFGEMNMLISCHCLGPTQNTSDGQFAIRKDGTADTYGFVGFVDLDAATATTALIYADYTVQTSSSQVIEVQKQGASTSLTIYTKGFWLSI